MALPFNYILPRSSITLIFMLTVFPSACMADLADELESLVGYTIFASKTIEGFYEDGKFKEEFDGCDFGRKIIFTDNTYVTCNCYGYQYAYHPTAVFLSNGISKKMAVGDEVYDIE